VTPLTLPEYMSQGRLDAWKVIDQVLTRFRTAVAERDGAEADILIWKLCHWITYEYDTYHRLSTAIRRHRFEITDPYTDDDEDNDLYETNGGVGFNTDDTD
jgi:hypothetical protein